MTRILTLTMNPAVDVSTSVQQVVPLHKLRCNLEHRYPGGGGLNVARVSYRLGADVTAVFPRGGAVGVSLENLLSAERVPHVGVEIAGETRESFNISELGTGNQFRFLLPGPQLSGAETAACTDALKARVHAGDFVVASGSLPRGVSDGFYAELARSELGSHARVVVDTTGAGLKRTLGRGIYLIKPSFSEFVELTGVSPLQRSEALRAIRAMIEQGLTRYVALSLGAEGAWLVGPDVIFAATPPRAVVRGTVGAGDSFLAGLICALTKEQPPQDALRHGVAAGTAALLKPGVDLCHAADVERLMPEVSVTVLSAG